MSLDDNKFDIWLLWEIREFKLDKGSWFVPTLLAVTTSLPRVETYKKMTEKSYEITDPKEGIERKLHIEKTVANHLYGYSCKAVLLKDEELDNHELEA